MSISIEDCFVFAPRMSSIDHTGSWLSIPSRPFFSSLLGSRDRLANVSDLVNLRTTPASLVKDRDRVFFISYPRKRPADADFIETILRRRNLVVLRDEHSFGEDDEVPHAIRENIHRATVFIATWSAEYACSPHCHDELELAMARHRDGKLAVWLFRLDDTRIVPPSARSILHHPATTRAELEGHVCRLLEKAWTTP